MKIVVCHKQVPDIALVGVDDGKLAKPPGTGMVNPYDSYAVEEGIRVKERMGGELIVLSLGDDTAEQGLRDSLALGADTAIHLKDSSFEGNDTISTARILALGIKKLGDVSLVICGKQAIDTDASAVSGAIAGFLGWPQVLFVRKIESINESQAEIVRVSDDGSDSCRVRLPAVLSVIKEINEPRLPSLKGKLASKKKDITVWGAGELGINTSQVGSGSPTHAQNSSKPPARKAGEILEGEPPEVAAKLFEKLREEKVI